MKEHFTCALPHIFGSMSREERKLRVVARDAAAKKLKALGFKQRYFQFERGNATEEKVAHQQAEAEAQKWRLEAGVNLTVYRGCFA